MRKVKLIVHETYQEKRKSEDVFAAVFLQTAQSDLFVAATTAKCTAYTYRDISDTQTTSQIAKITLPDGTEYRYEYDAMGNPLTYRGGMEFTWQAGRKLAGMVKDGVSATYKNKKILTTSYNICIDKDKITRYTYAA